MESELLNRQKSWRKAFVMFLFTMFYVAATAGQQYSFSPVNIKQAHMVYSAERFLFQGQSRTCYVAMTQSHQDSVATCLYGLSWKENSDSLFFSQLPEGYVFDVENEPNIKADLHFLAIGKAFLSVISEFIHDVSLLSSFLHAENNSKNGKRGPEKTLFLFGDNGNFFYTHYLDSTSRKVVNVFEDIALGTRLGDRSKVLSQEREILKLHKLIKRSIPDEVLNEDFFNNIDTPADIHKRIVEKENEQRKILIGSYIFIFAACLASIYMLALRIKESRKNKNI